MIKYFLVVAIMPSLLIAGICQDKGLADKEHQHFFYYEPDKQGQINFQDYSEIRFDESATSVKLETIGFENWRGGEQVLKDMEKARVKLEKVLASNIFREEVFGHIYRGEPSFKKNKGKTNEEIHQIILDGADKYNRTVDNEIDMILCPYYSGKNVLGYTYPSRKEVWVNFKYYRDGYNGFDVNSMVGNFIHEWIHNAGFGHSKKRNRTRKYTVPYAIGYMARDIAKNIQ